MEKPPVVVVSIPLADQVDVAHGDYKAIAIRALLIALKGGAQ